MDGHFGPIYDGHLNNYFSGKNVLATYPGNELHLENGWHFDPTLNAGHQNN